jgi:hypothetical protein
MGDGIRLIARYEKAQVRSGNTVGYPESQSKGVIPGAPRKAQVLQHDHVKWPTRMSTNHRKELLSSTVDPSEGSKVLVGDDVIQAVNCLLPELGSNHHNPAKRRTNASYSDL